MRVLAPILLTLAAFARAHAGDVTLFDADPAHPWNRLYAALFAEAPGGASRSPRAPAEWDRPDERLSGKKYAELLGALDIFLAKDAEKLLTSPLHRALLQSATWATFDQVSDPRGIEREARLRVARRCAEIIRRLALSDAEIVALPDTYAAGLKLANFPTDFEPAHPARTFLPPRLLDPQGPWVMLLSTTDRSPAAIQHVRAVHGRAVFYALIKLPGGRAATLEYLRLLASHPRPLAWNEMYARYPYARSPVQPNPDLPQFPGGTQVALMRRMLLTNSRGELVVTPVMQSLQVRVYKGNPAPEVPGEISDQEFFELRLSPSDWLANRAVFVEYERDQLEVSMTFEEPSIFAGTSCRDCHGRSGILSVQTYIRSFGPPRATPWFEPTSRETQDRLAREWKRNDYSWGLLQGYWDGAGTRGSVP